MSTGTVPGHIIGSHWAFIEQSLQQCGNFALAFVAAKDDLGFSGSIEEVLALSRFDSSPTLHPPFLLFVYLDRTLPYGAVTLNCYPFDPLAVPISIAAMAPITFQADG